MPVTDRLRPATRQNIEAPHILARHTQLRPALSVPTGASYARFDSARRLRNALRFGVGAPEDFRRILRNARKQERKARR